MSLIKWTPLFENIKDLDINFDLVGHGVSNFTPAIDLYQTKDDVVVETPLTGIDPKKIEIAIENDVLTISGKTEKKSEVDEKNYYRKEVRSGSFFRSVALPVHVQGDKANAEYEKGILKITVPKLIGGSMKKIEVKTKD
jgi:HSP20 family protein